MELTDKYKLRLEKKIKSFSESYMNNSKWKRVFTELINQKEIIKKCEIYDFFNSAVNEIDWKNINDNNYSEYITQDYITNDITTSEYSKTYYKEIEYIEFRKSWVEDTNFRLINSKTITQNTKKIKEELSKIGQFKWEENRDGLKLIGYRNN